MLVDTVAVCGTRFDDITTTRYYVMKSPCEEEWDKREIEKCLSGLTG